MPTLGGEVERHKMMRVEQVNGEPVIGLLVECPACGGLWDPIVKRWHRQPAPGVEHAWSPNWPT